MGDKITLTMAQQLEICDILKSYGCPAIHPASLFGAIEKYGEACRRDGVREALEKVMDGTMEIVTGTETEEEPAWIFGEPVHDWIQEKLKPTT